jgi:hypothetical protein
MAKDATPVLGAAVPAAHEVVRALAAWEAMAKELAGAVSAPSSARLEAGPTA